MSATAEPLFGSVGGRPRARMVCTDPACRPVVMSGPTAATAVSRARIRARQHNTATHPATTPGA